MKFSIRILYLYLFSFVGLIITVIGTVRLIDIALKSFVFRKADTFVSYPARPKMPGDGEEPEPNPEELEKYRTEETERQRQREASGALSMIIVGIPLYLYHWKAIRKEN